MAITDIRMYVNAEDIGSDATDEMLAAYCDCMAAELSNCYPDAAVVVRPTPDGQAGSTWINRSTYVDEEDDADVTATIESAFIPCCKAALAAVQA